MTGEQPEQPAPNFVGTRLVSSFLGTRLQARFDYPGRRAEWLAERAAELKADRSLLPTR